MVFPAKRLCVVPSMEGVRWAFSCGTWLPSRAEWLLAMRSIQPEEKERIGKFVFARDAKAALALKESFIKAIGVGLGFEMQRLEFDVSPLNMDIGQVYKETCLILDGEEEKEWAFEESKIDEHHFVAVAVRKPDGSRHQNVSYQDDSKLSQRKFTILNFNDLVASAIPMTPEDPSFWDCFCFTEEILIRNGTKS
ncbi:L-aminoadipate-semialdehyde dehydrogenase-phosphopantetheinyl transferase isoform X2 [Mus musculus]|uniref:L-aminoadipate-semialdehyde dehydrogenase-phosphopantetheinyl transferase isoform X2 n=1 Tax=Mus musculus TaxID=10090 RepID=UPI0003D757CA|nr:L-aminoadipate-semialdehyde dehydrogenase-phosphopantetheinyl transferase isoform X2 [Mus musculus]|eukprot:XP_006509940.1 PREDICTED: L-aminoadipate-semialdehyde dehydrogenase-phosphopantetheinyl transferase isoform X1 [Mus musculus]